MKPDEHGRYAIPRDGIVMAYLTLAYDLYVVRQNIRFQEVILDRLRRRIDFVGVRCELLVAATFARAGFHVDPEDESDSKVRHPEFIATHKATKFVLLSRREREIAGPAIETPRELASTS
jgi:hypothetical protein